MLMDKATAKICAQHIGIENQPDLIDSLNDQHPPHE